MEEKGSKMKVSFLNGGGGKRILQQSFLMKLVEFQSVKWAQ